MRVRGQATTPRDTQTIFVLSRQCAIFSDLHIYLCVFQNTFQRYRVIERWQCPRAQKLDVGSVVYGLASYPGRTTQGLNMGAGPHVAFPLPRGVGMRL